LSKRTLTTAAALAVALSGLPTLAQARTATAATGSSQSYQLKATLNAGKEVPAPKGATGATGVFTAKLVVAGKKSSFVWQLKFSGLTGKAIASHVHYGVAGKAGVVALPLCVPCASSPSHGEYKGTYVATRAFLKAVLHGGAYVNIHTKKNPNGEIRGQIKATAAG
jgi:hypothetical protein